MNAFGNYSDYYDLLYADKNYEAEAEFVDTILHRHLPGAKHILELGCGTGRHAFSLASKGYQVRGIDQSHQMLERARVNLSRLTLDSAPNVSFSQGDIRHLGSIGQFDAAIALFHVVSYLPTNEDIQNAFISAKSNLRKGGIFLFDCWYGPAVLTDRPTARIKRIENEKVNVVRVAEPLMHANKNLVEIKYQIFIEDKSNHHLSTIEEFHRLRYLFTPEVDFFFEKAGLKMLESGEWMSRANPGFGTWYVYFAGRA
jgi:SAM-dependent methyltransferase